MSKNSDHSELLKTLRRKLHSEPHLSLSEQPTIDLLERFLLEHCDGECVRIVQGNGLMCHFKSDQDGPHLVVRADVDALPINESSGVEYASKNKGISHACGHDGHSTILCGLAIALSENPIQRGSITLLFQPAEEIGKGSQLVLEDRSFLELNIDQFIALHNIPGYELGSVLIRKGVQCAASTGVIITLNGETAHAATPEAGNSPIQAAIDIIDYLNGMAKIISGPGFGLKVTVAGVSSGGPNFGVSPGQATIWATLRTLDTDLLKSSCSSLETTVMEIASKHGIKVEMNLTEHFDATINNSDLVDRFIKCVQDSGYPLIYMEEPFYWSEDVGRFTTRYPGFLFGLGAGLQCFPLHHSAYDFPDELIPFGVDIFENYIREHLK